MPTDTNPITQQHPPRLVPGRLSLVPYLPIERHGVIGDRRTAGLVASDGTLDWLCLPDYDGAPVFGSLLDASRGGFWRMGPAIPQLGSQRYVEDTMALVTHWATSAGELELTDTMAWPESDRPDEHVDRRVVLRRLRCTRGRVDCALEIWPRHDFTAAAEVTPAAAGLVLRAGERTLGLWTTCRVAAEPNGGRAAFTLSAGEEVWAVLALDEPPEAWSVAWARDALERTCAYWRDWLGAVTYSGPRRAQMRRSALTVHLLGYAPTNSLVAAPTTSLPERLGGDRNYDYRYAWVRDASLSVAGLSRLGDTQTAGRYMDWLASLGSSTDAPLQVVYHVSGGTKLPQQERTDLAGYRGSLPVRIGNRAAGQSQLGSLGWFVECAAIHLAEGAEWKEPYWDLVRRAADYSQTHWHEPDSGIWELASRQHYIGSKVMSWVVLDRALKIAEQVGHAGDTAGWRQTRDTIHAEVMDRGWSERLHAFQQYYGAEALDAAALLIPLTGFLPPDHPRVLATADRIAESLTIDGFVYRFVPEASPVRSSNLPLGEFEGAFLPCTFWLATTYAMAGRPNDAEGILERAEAVAGELGLFAEEVDPRTRTFLGNTPLLFAQVEYVRAVIELNKARAKARAHSQA